MAVMMIRAETESGSIYQFRVFTPVNGDQVTHVLRLPGRGAVRFFEEASLVVRYSPIGIGKRMQIAYRDLWTGEIQTSTSTPITKVDVWSEEA